MPQLNVRHPGMAVFAEVHLGKKPTPVADGWVFETEMQIEQLTQLYAGSEVQRLYELFRVYRLPRKNHTQ